MDKEASAAAGRIRTTLDRIGGVWSAVEGQATFNVAEMEADIREVLEDYDAVVAERDTLQESAGSFALKLISAVRDEGSVDDAVREMYEVCVNEGIQLPVE